MAQNNNKTEAIKEKTKTVLGYLRVSTEDQADFGLSITVQEQRCREAAEKEGRKNIMVIKDEGRSGKTLHREGIQEVIRLVEQDQVSDIYVTHSDRLARNHMDHLYLRSIFRKHSAVLHYLSGQSAEDNAMAIMSDNMFAAVNQYHSDNTSEKTKETTYAKARAGYMPGKPPPGYISIQNPDKTIADKLAQRIIVPDPVMAPLITEFFQMFATGSHNVYQLNDIFYERGLRSKLGKKMAPAPMYRILANRFYISEFHWGGIHIKNAKHEPLVDPVTFQRVQMVLSAHNHHACRRRKHKWLLSGFLWCPMHNRYHVGEVQFKKHKAYYRCGVQHGCGAYWEQVDLEETIADQFKKLEFSDAFIQKIINKAKGQYDKSVKEYDRTRQGLVNLKTAFEARRDSVEKKLFEGVIDNEVYTRQKNEINEQLRGITTRLSELEEQRAVDITIVEDILLFGRNIYKAYKKSSFELKRAILSFFWTRFEIQDRQLLISRLTPLFERLLQEKAMSKKSSIPKKPIVFKGVQPQLLSIIRGAYRDSNPDWILHRDQC